jgi:hypothetical protein
MSISRSRTFSQFSSRRLLLATALVASCVCAFAGQASASVYPAHTVLNYCSNRAGLGKVVRGTYHGLGFLAWDSNRDGRIDHMAIDTNRGLGWGVQRPGAAVVPVLISRRSSAPAPGAGATRPPAAKCRRKRSMGRDDARVVGALRHQPHRA